jgi:chromosomal replication initiator protein
MIHYYIAPGLSYMHLQGAIKSAKRQTRTDKDLRLSQNESLAHRIMLVVSEYYRISIDDLRGESRLMKYKTARQVAQDLIRWKAKMPLVKIGKMFNRDHSTVVYSCQTVADLRRFDKKFDAEYKEIESYV